MPFTLSHAVAVLPLRKIKWLSTTGLVFGAMSPDLEYFARMQILSTYGHLWLEGLVGNVLLSLVFIFSFHIVIRDVTINHMPYFLKSRLISYKDFDWMKYFRKNWFSVILSIIIGMYTHLLWDAFTHEWGYFAKLFTIIQEVWIDYPTIKGYKFLQYSSSVLGLILIAFFIYNLPKSQLEQYDFTYSFWITCFLIAAVIFFIRIYFFPIDLYTANIIVVPLSAIYLSLFILGLHFKLTNP